MRQINFTWWVSAMRFARIVWWPWIDWLVDGRRKTRGWWRSVTGVWTSMVPARLAFARTFNEGTSTSTSHVPFPMECCFAEKHVTRNFNLMHRASLWPLQLWLSSCVVLRALFRNSFQMTWYELAEDVPCQHWPMPSTSLVVQLTTCNEQTVLWV